MYYYIKYSITCSVTRKIHKTDCVSDKHPFEWLKFFDSFDDKWKLTEWVEITKEEYENGKSVIGIG